MMIAIVMAMQPVCGQYQSILRLMMARMLITMSHVQALLLRHLATEQKILTPELYVFFIFITTT